MNERDLRKALGELSTGELHYFDSLGSTNDEALAWATQGAPDLSLVIADEQTAGRGRLGRKWFTPAGTALAFSLIFRPTEVEQAYLSRTVGLAGLAVCRALAGLSMSAELKWPNDVLVFAQKICGILVEAVWTGEDMDCQVIGIGMNLRRESVPEHAQLQFPATSLENLMSPMPERELILHDILAALIELRPKLSSAEFMKLWEEKLAFRGEVVKIQSPEGPTLQGELLGLDSDGSLRLKDENGNPVTVHFGDISLRPAA